MLSKAIKEVRVPESLLVRQMILIDKKSPSLFVSNRCPLTVSCLILNVITKIMHARMDTICQKNGYYIKVQYGFRSGQPTSDCIFMLLSAIRKAKKKVQGPMSNLLHKTPRTLHQTLTMIYPFYYISMGAGM